MELELGLLVVHYQKEVDVYISPGKGSDLVGIEASLPGDFHQELPASSFSLGSTWT